MTREEANTILEEVKMLDDSINLTLEKMLSSLSSLPSAVPEREKGEWIEKEMFDGDTAYECSECGELFCLIDGTPADNLYNFFPNCGADMRGE